MLLSNEFLYAVLKVATEETRTAEVAKLLNATVMLQGITANKSTFTGSGVIYAIPGTEVTYQSGKWSSTDEKFTIVVTALHNLYVYNDGKIPVNSAKKPSWPEDNSILTNFQAACKIHYGPADIKFSDAPASQASIDHVVPLFIGNYEQDNKIIKIPAEDSKDGDEFHLVNLNGNTTTTGGNGSGLSGISPREPNDAWQYDVALLISKDELLFDYLTASCDYMTTADVTLLAEGDYESHPFVPAQLALTNPSYPTDQPVLSRSEYLGLQMGYGKTSTRTNPKGGKLGAPGTIGLPGKDKAYKPPTKLPAVAQDKLQYKNAITAGVQTHVNFYNDTGEFVLPQKYGIFLGCSEGNNSTFSGDSGGPYFVLTQNENPKTYLIGVSYGAGVGASEQGSKRLWEFSNNAATSLEWFYTALADLRFQNV